MIDVKSAIFLLVGPMPYTIYHMINHSVTRALALCIDPIINLSVMALHIDFIDKWKWNGKFKLLYIIQFYALYSYTVIPGNDSLPLVIWSLITNLVILLSSVGNLKTFKHLNKLKELNPFQDERFGHCLLNTIKRGQLVQRLVQIHRSNCQVDQ